MNKERMLQILLSPCVTEKAARAEADRQYLFKVAKNARKDEIKHAVELMFDVKVEKVRLCNVRARRKMFKRLPGYRPSWKKAWVRLGENNSIDLSGV